MVRIINTTHECPIPAGVTCAVNHRVVSVTGKRGTLTKDFSHCKLDMSMVKGKFHVELWFGGKKAVAGAKTIVSHVRNMVKGVTEGFQYKLRAAYAHFPVNTAIEKDGEGRDVLCIRNFLGEKRIRKVAIPKTMKISNQTGAKDEIMLQGNDIDQVSMVAAQIQQSCAVKRKDIRKFLDGVYVHRKGPVDC